MEALSFNALKTSLVTASLAMLFTACSAHFSGSYNPAYIPYEDPEFISDDRALLLMTEAHEQYVYSGSPQSHTLRYSTLTLPLGEILKQATLEALKDSFAAGVEMRTVLKHASDFALIIQPQIERFDYSYSALRNLGLATTPEVTIALRIKVLNNDGVVVRDEVFESGVVSGRTCWETCDHIGSVISLAHQATYRVAKNAIQAIGQESIGSIHVTETSEGKTQAN